jgi:hypothetical protein
MPIQDAVDLARFLVETTIGFVRFAVFMPKSVGGAVEIAAITKHEGFRWVQRKASIPPNWIRTADAAGSRHPGLMPWVVRKVRAGTPRHPGQRWRPRHGNSTSTPQLRQNSFTEDIDEGALVAAHLM